MGRPARISRDQILDAARTAFGARGFAATTLADVAKSLEVTPAAILRHFESKQQLFTAAMSARAIELPACVMELATADAAADPRVVLRRFAGEFVPFIRKIIGTTIAVQMHQSATTVVVPFDTAAEETPPRRGLRILAGYFRRAMNAGVIRRGDPRATALLFIGQLHSYVFIHQVLGVTPVYPLDAYLDALIGLWTDGAFVGGRTSRPPAVGRTGRPPSLPGGIRARKTKSAAEDRAGAGGARRRGGVAVVRPRAAKAETAGARRNARGADGEHRLAGRRTRDKRPRR
ncbi:MAG TPA: TetR/AcrR family transcriptional regulator [Thermoanaerobaculia bacterium]|nr:TetR/AcrR family transcriptional regulator [Thermoanaerobaculia bacterium]